MSHTSLTGRKVRCDATFLSADDNDVIALATDCTLTFDREVIEVTAPMDTWKHREQCGGLDWNIQIGKLITSPVFPSLIITGGLIVVSADTVGGDTFYGVGLITGQTNNWEDPNTEQLTVVGAGLAATVT